MNENNIAVKNEKAYGNDIARIISGAILSLLLILVVLIFRNSFAFAESRQAGGENGKLSF